ncbi:MAG: STAS-like domain-containing protein [Gallionella sp.]
MRISVLLKPYANGHLVGSRLSAAPIREKIEIAFAQGAEVVLDFSCVEATQSFIDGLIGVLILQRGPDVLGRLVFKSCSEDVRAILQFVAADRYRSHSHLTW